MSDASAADWSIPILFSFLSFLFSFIDDLTKVKSSTVFSLLLISKMEKLHEVMNNLRSKCMCYDKEDEMKTVINSFPVPSTTHSLIDTYFQFFPFLALR